MKLYLLSIYQPDGDPPRDVLAEYRGQRRAGLSPRARTALLVANSRGPLLPLAER
jgi:hypothetical protein